MYSKRIFVKALVIVIAGFISCFHACPLRADTNTWSVTNNGVILEIAYGQGANFPQFAALYLNSGYLRLINGKNSGWGTSVVLTPSFWTGGEYYQGCQITATTSTVGSDLLILFTGTISTLSFRGTVRISPPANNSISAAVSISTNGSVTLDNRANEAFKPVMLSSMHISSEEWDSQSAFAGAQTYQLPDSGWIISPAVSCTEFGLNGGTSKWKTNAPTVKITLDMSRQVTGWVTASSDPNSDNVGLWAASDSVLANWSYTIACYQRKCCIFLLLL
ncbi:MAG: hypothetical protein NTY36_18020 [Deltaproteobacteria bacterium]|nr:hypothetical protein [Deltaproteobacteria bacterium]